MHEGSCGRIQLWAVQMRRSEFWDTIERARARCADRANRMCDALRHELESRMPSDVAAFANDLAETLAEADTWELRAAARILRDADNDDDFLAFRGWLIANGESAYCRILDDVELLVELDLGLNPREECFLRDFVRVPHDVYEEMTGEAMLRPQDALPDDPSGVVWEARELPRRFPRLWARIVDQRV